MGTAALSWGTQARIRHLCTQVSSEERRSVHIGGSCSDTLALMQGLWVPFSVTLPGCTPRCPGVRLCTSSYSEGSALLSSAVTHRLAFGACIARAPWKAHSSW